MNTEPSPRRAIADVPLPGHYQVLTMQCNVTIYPPSGVCKFVLTTRDPSPGRQLELSRVARQCPWVVLSDQLEEHLGEALRSMLYLSALPVSPLERS